MITMQVLYRRDGDIVARVRCNLCEYGPWQITTANEIWWHITNHRCTMYLHENWRRLTMPERP